jgi:dihydrofolate synthase / folylpolyglutamate synthase
MDSYSETLKRIYNLRGGMIDLRLERMERALALWDHPENKFPSLHIAGTNGKGSTAAMLHSMLSLAGYRTALYTSPHLVSFTERVRVGEREIDQVEVVALADEVHRCTAAAAVPLTFFEFVTVMAFIYFARQAVDVAVIEVGLGGRLDATNLITPLVSLITTISKDHQEYLGPNELSIAREKAGIIKPGVPVVCGKIAPEIAALFKSIAQERGSAAFFLGADFGITLKNEGVFDYTGIKQFYSDLTVALRGGHQRLNAAVALAATELFTNRFPIDAKTLRRGLGSVRWPGRLEVMHQSPTVILDGAHNREGVAALIDALKELKHGRKIKLLFAVMADKEWDPMVCALAPAVDEIVFTQVAMERSADPQQLVKKLDGQGPHRVIRESRRALETLLNESTDDEIIVVAGSLYLLGEVRPVLENLARENLIRAENRSH